MADNIDRANEVTDLFLEEALTNKETIDNKIKGICLNCGDKTDGYFCDEDCRDDYEKEMKIKKQNGEIK